MKFSIDKKIFEQFPGLHIGIVVAKGIDNTRHVPEVQTWLRDKEERIRKTYSLETLSVDPRIIAWQQVYRVFGAKPKDHRSSVENLYSLVLQGATIRHITTLVDLYNFISLKYMLPVGGEDLDTIKGDIILTFASNREAPLLLLGDKEPRPPHEGEVIYKDDVSAICRRWNWREADRTKLTESTKNAILVIEALPPVTKDEIENAAKELKELAEKLCGGEVDYRLLDKANFGMEF